MATKSTKTMKNGYSKSRNPAHQVITKTPKLKVNFDGQSLNGTGFFQPMLTAGTYAAGIYYLDCANTNTTGTAANVNIQSVDQALTGITSYYSEYKYRSATFTWMPYVSPGIADGGAQIYIGYFDNPEVISNAALSGTALTLNTLVKAARNMRSFNAWERFTYTVPVSSRRKTFDVNLNNTVVSADSNDRSTQGAVIAAAVSPSAIVSLGQWRVTYLVDLHKLDPIAAAYT